MVFFCAFLLFLASTYARNGLPTTSYSQETSNSAQIIKEYIPGVGEVYTGGVKELTPEQIEKIPTLTLKKRNLPLPDEFSNGNEVSGNNKYFPDPVVNQGPYGSCAQAAGTGHHVTYALCLARDVDGNPYPHNYTWNFLNNGDGAGSSFLEGWEIINTNGIPTQSAWGSGISADTKWMTGYDKYFDGMKNRYLAYHKIDISTEQGIEDLKQWITDMGEGAAVGGIATFSVNCIPPSQNGPPPKVPSGKPKAGWICIPAWGHTGGHVMTIVGWDDNVVYDVNEDGEYTNDEDINNDGVTDVQDWEKGAWLVANTWGSNWGKRGYFYMLYRTGALERGNAFNDTVSTGGQNQPPLDNTVADLKVGGLTTNKHVFVIKARLATDKVKQAFTYKIEIQHKQRDQLSISAGVANSTSANAPEFSHRYNVLNYQGGDFPMQGRAGTSYETIEVGLDAKFLLNHVDKKEAKFFLMIDAKGEGSGEVKKFSLIDYRGSSPKEVVCTETNKTITPNNTTILSINYNSDNAPLNITTDALPPAQQNQSYSKQLEAEGGSNPYTWELLDNVYYEVNSGSESWQITEEVSPNDTDDGYSEQSLGFDFPYFGKTVKKIYIGTDGIILFEPNFVYVRSPKALQATKAIAGLGADYVIGTGDGIYFKGSSDKAIIRWKTKHMWSETGLLDIDVDFAVVLYPSGKIEYYYGNNMSGDVTGMAMGASNGLGSHFTFDYGAVSDIPNNHKAALMPEEKVNGLSVNGNGLLSGTPTSNDGEYRVTFKVTDALEIKKTKSYQLVIGATPIENAFTNNIATPLTVLPKAQGAMQFCFSTKKAADASLEAFSLNGKKMYTLFKGQLQSGSHALTWLPNNEQSAVAHGVYICKLRVGKEQTFVKVGLVK